MKCFLIILLITTVISGFWVFAIDKANSEWQEHKDEYKSETDYWGDMP